MLLTPVYTLLAYRYKFWKKQRTTSTTGEKLEVFSKLHANKFKRNIPTMAGVIFVIAIAAITFIFNLNRGQTWLPIAALIGGAVVGLLDDIINVRSHGKGVAGLRSSLKFIMITVIGLAFGWFFYAKLCGFKNKNNERNGHCRVQNTSGRQKTSRSRTWQIMCPTEESS